MPLQLTFRSMTHSSSLAAQVQRRAEKVEQFFQYITSCRVVLELSGHHHRHGDRYRASIHVGLPGHELVVSHDPPNHHENAHATVDRVFDEAERQLQKWVACRSERRPAHSSPGGSEPDRS
jgi:ribosomal subunit interface protein